MAPTSVETLSEATRQIQKALEADDPASTLLTLMKPLESVRVSEADLRQSKIGVAVSRLRQSKSKEVQEKASRLVNKWKNDVRSKAAAARAGSGSPAALKTGDGVKKESGTETAKKSGIATPAAGADVKKEELVKNDHPKVEPAKRNAKTDEVDYELTGEFVRDGSIKLMYDGLAFMSSESPSVILGVARRIEQAAYARFKYQTSTDYKTRMRSLFHNLKIKSNKTLRVDVLMGTIPPEEFVAMTTEDLKSAEKKAEERALAKANMKAAMTAKEEKAISTTMQCGKCKQYKVSYSQAQTRSADEPLTTFCECVACGHRWKFS